MGTKAEYVTNIKHKYIFNYSHFESYSSMLLKECDLHALAFNNDNSFAKWIRKKITPIRVDPPNKMS